MHRIVLRAVVNGGGKEELEKWLRIRVRVECKDERLLERVSE